MEIPLNTNSKMLILTDNNKYIPQGDEATLNKDINKVMGYIIDILNIYGDNECLIIALNINSANKIKSELKSLDRDATVTYYGSSDLIGVACEKRVCIAIGFCKIDSNAFDNRNFNTLLSKLMRKEREQINTSQGFQRVKDSEGKVKSVVFALYSKTEDCINAVKWGIKRQVTIEEVKVYGRKVEKVCVTCDEYISQPTIRECNSFNEMIKEACRWKESKNTGETTASILIKNAANEIKQSKIVNTNNITPTKQNTRKQFPVQGFKNTTKIMETPRDLLRLINRGDRPFVM